MTRPTQEQVLREVAFCDSKIKAKRSTIAELEAEISGLRGRKITLLEMLRSHYGDWGHDSVADVTAEDRRRTKALFGGHSDA